MDSKRKANGTAAREEDRSAKRRKVEDFDLSKGESVESTTAYGLAFLDLLRRTADKNGRQVASTFESLPPRTSNEAYYKATALPISLELIEQKLNDGDFENLAELESYFKRMISNAKDFYARGSTTHEDAERVRKTLSNWMTKRNPAYQTRGYQAMPTPVPQNGAHTPSRRQAAANHHQDEEEEDEEEDDEEAVEDEEEDEPEEEEEVTGRGSKRRSIILKRRGSVRTPRNSTVGVAQPSPRIASASAKPDHQYEDVPYKGLSFQEAQEKLVEELIRYKTPDYDDAYFEPFVNLPPRALKDYYRMISDPLSLKKLQKMVKGILHRGDSGGVSDFKTWAAFEEKSQLLWENAYYYNEENSEIYELAQELEKHFAKELKKAKAAVSDPPQPKIKLKVGQASDTPASNKKITIHVGRGGTDSPAPPTADSSADGRAVNGARPPSGSLNHVDKARSVSATPSSQAQGSVLKPEDGGQASPATSVQPVNGNFAASQFAPTTVRPPVPAVVPQAVPRVNLLEPKKLRRDGKGLEDALISRLRIQSFTNNGMERTTALTLFPKGAEMTQSATINLLPSQNRIAILVQLPEFLQERQFSLWALLDKGPLKASHQPLPGQLHTEKAFELILRPGMNVIEAHLVAAIPKEERREGGPEIEVEVFTVLANVLRI